MADAGELSGEVRRHPQALPARLVVCAEQSPHERHHQQ